MPKSDRVRVRRLTAADFSFVRELASSQPNFTIPAPYLLWLLMKIKPDFCLVAEHEEHGPLAYLLAVPMDTPANSIYVWQLASSEQGRKLNAVLVLMRNLRAITLRQSTRLIVFSTIPGSAAYRAIRRYARQLFDAKPEIMKPLPELVAPDEVEVRVVLRSSNKR